MEGNKEILIIEDDEDVRALLKFLLEKESFRVEQVIDGEQASQRIRKYKPPDLVLLDIMMPYRDGFEILGEIRASRPWRNVPVLIITARDNEEHITRGVEAGVNDYIIKPFKPADLIARIKKILDTPAFSS
ncbi:MAG TPA: response regulator transcription factor [Gammaproteobacteria bacterium]|nr:response regulator transcription factor [Gammaproteobacteria bacterium]